jgi:hypothetical protein
LEYSHYSCRQFKRRQYAGCDLGITAHSFDYIGRKQDIFHVWDGWDITRHYCQGIAGAALLNGQSE